MDGVSQFQAPRPVVVQEQRSPWDSLAPNLLQAIVGGAIMAKIKNGLDQNLLKQQAEIELAKQGYTPAAKQAEQQPGIWDRIKGMVGLGDNPALPQAPADMAQTIAGLPAVSASPGTVNILGKPYNLPKAPSITPLNETTGLIRQPTGQWTPVDLQKHTSLSDQESKLYSSLVGQGVNPVVALGQVKSAGQKPEAFNPAHAYVQDRVKEIMSNPSNALNYNQAIAEAAKDAPGMDKEQEIKNKNKAIAIGQKIEMKQPVSPEDQSWYNSYQKVATFGPVAYGEARGEIILKPVLDTKNDNALSFRNTNEINLANEAEPGRFVPAGEGTKAVNKAMLINDMRGASTNLRKIMDQVDSEGGFTNTQMAELAAVASDPDTKSAWNAFWKGEVGKSLTQSQRQYLIHARQIQENSLALRSALSMGQGSDQQRAAILSTVPSAVPPDMAFAREQLDAFDQQLERVATGIPNVPLRGKGTFGTAATGGNGATHIPDNAYSPEKTYTPGDVVFFPGKGNFKSLGGGKWLPQ